MLKQIAKGHRSEVYLCKYKGRKAVKKLESKNTQAINRIQNEVFWLKKLNIYKLGPKLYFYNDNYFICEYISGERIISYLEKSKNPTRIIK